MIHVSKDTGTVIGGEGPIEILNEYVNISAAICDHLKDKIDKDKLSELLIYCTTQGIDKADKLKKINNK